MSNLETYFMDFMTHLSEVFQNNTTIESVINEPLEKKLERVENFNNSIKNITNFNYFLKSKIKLFSHKDKDTLLISESLFGSSLKKIFNNQDDTIKLTFWKDLHNLLLSYNEYVLTLDPNNAGALDRVDKLQTNNTPKLNMKTDINKLLNTDNLNDTTNNMLNDIFNSFESSMNGSSGNPFNNIMNISQTITEKYKDKIENGEIDLGDILKSMTSLPGMENVGGMVDVLTKQMQGSTEQPKEKIIIDENFSTSIVDQGVNEEQDSGMNVASLLKTVSSLGLDSSIGDLMSGNLGNLMSGNSDNSDDNEQPNQMNDLGNIMNLFNKIGQTTDQNEMNELFEKELGIDMNALTNQISSLNK
jgi:hypothetical protein